MANHLDDLIVFNRLANYAKLDTAEGILYDNGLYEQLDVGNLTQGWDVWDIRDNGDGTFTQGPLLDDLAAGGVGKDTLLGEQGDDVLYGGYGYNLDRDDTQAMLDNPPRPKDPETGDPWDNHSFDGFEFSDFDTTGHVDYEGYDRAGDLLDGGEGNDTIFGQLGKDTLLGGSGEDSMFGGRHGDLMDGGTGSDDMFGESGLDTMAGGDEGEGSYYTWNSEYGQYHYQYYNIGGDWMSGGRARDSMDGESGFDTMYGDQCADTMFGGAGYDLMFGGNGADYMRGDDEQGNDTGDGLGCFYAGIEMCEYRIGYSGNGDSMFGGRGDDLMYGGIGDDFMKGNAHDDIMYGEEDDDHMEGNAGNDTMYGGDGCDDMFGGVGDDSMDGNDGWDFMKGGEGNDIMNGNAGDDDMIGGDGDDQMSGGEGNDTMEGNAGDDDMEGNDGNDYMSGGEGADDMDGGNDDDIMCGGDDNDTMAGGAGNDQVHGEAGNDQLSGGDGNDLINGGAGADTMLGGAGDDVIWFEGATERPADGGVYEVAVGGSGDDTFVYNFSYPGDPNNPGEADDHSIGDSGFAYILDFDRDDTLQLCLNGDISGLECDFSRIDEDGVYDDGDLAIVNRQLATRLAATNDEGQSPIVVHDNGEDTWIIFDNTAGPGQDISDPNDLIDANIWLKGVTGGEGNWYADINDMIADGYNIVINADLSEAPGDLAEGYNYYGFDGFLDNYDDQFQPCAVECEGPECRFDDPWGVIDA